jgi:hypothetical protein
LLAAFTEVQQYATGCLICNHLPKDTVTTHNGESYTVSWTTPEGELMEGLGETRAAALLEFSRKFFVRENGTKGTENG